MEYKFKEIPGEYYMNPLKAGKLERVYYSTLTQDGKKKDKHAMVYLPVGYNDKENVQRKYNILYLMHGAMGSAESWFGSEYNPTPFKNIVDHMIEKEDIAPMLIVTPSYYTNPSQGEFRDGEETLLFQKELTKDLIPAVEEKYRTYAMTADAQGLKDSRSHRAFGGYSMGSVTTWYVFTHHLDAFRYFMPMSADCWELGMLGGWHRPKETAQYLAGRVKNFGYQAHDYFIYSSVGEAGMAYEGVTAMMKGLRTQPLYFVFTDKEGKGNIHFDSVPGYEHDYPYGWQYVYNSLPTFFRQE